ncbi:MAG: bifunctional tetrahydrofolate synthase/dihydrofolate synthase [Pseudomonadota bacterium]
MPTNGSSDHGPRSLSQWLARLERLHPDEIDLGLARVGEVARRLGLIDAFPMVITVAGTNGKGSVVATLEALLLAQGCTVGAHTSPHILRYNERIKINGLEADDEAICQAFLRIEEARNDISLTYFEFGVLAALWLFREAGPDVIVLETGLGGRLDAVNILDADIAVISSIGLDHQQWLGDDRESIGREKAGIFRAGRPVVCVDDNPPVSLRDIASSLECTWHGTDNAIHWEEHSDTWSWSGLGRDGQQREMSALPVPRLALSNVSAALQALALTPYWPSRDAVEAALSDLHLAGRRQWLKDAGCGCRVILDVAHNEQAAAALAVELNRQPVRGRVHAVLAMMRDKDHAGFYRALESSVDFWYITQVDQPRCLPADQLLERLRMLGAETLHGPCEDVEAAYRSACREAATDDTIVVCGSFFTVSAMLRLADTVFSPDPER